MDEMQQPRKIRSFWSATKRMLGLLGARKAAMAWVYPFCGFNASRIMREGWNYRTYGIILTLACYAFLLVY